MRSMLKRAVFATGLVLTAPLVVLAWLESRLTASQACFVFGSQLLAIAPGWPGSVLRAAYYFGTLERCAWEVHVGFGTVFSQRAAALGRQASTGCYCVIGHADIGAGVVMASRVSVPSGRRQHVDDEGRFSAAARFERVAIGERTWVGEGAIVMANVGERCVVSAGAVVLDAMPDGVLVAGNPARAVRTLDARFTGGGET
jgi:acetyltransferase-like isoleucine patch superfamily enzyme